MRRNLRLSNMHIKLIVVIALVLTLFVAMLLGRGFSANPYTGELKVEPGARPLGNPTVETFGQGSGISIGKDSSTETTVHKASARSAVQRASAPSPSTAQYVTHGDASPVALGPGASASATLGD